MKDKKAGQNVDLIALVFVVLLILTFVAQLGKVTNNFDKMFPAFVLIVLGALSILLGIKVFVNPEIKKIFTEPRFREIIISIIAGFIWLIMIKPVGFFVSAYIILNFYSFLIDDKLKQTKNTSGIGKIAMVTLLTNLCIVLFVYGVFVLFLGVHTPKGILF